MKFIWCDTETTGLAPVNAKPFQVAMIFVSTIKIDGVKTHDESERIFYLNPFDIPGTEYSEEAGKVHGYKKEVIESFDKSAVVVKTIDSFLHDCENYKQPEKLFFCGYNGKFDYDHLTSLFQAHNLDFTQYFHKNILDVWQQVKNAGYKKVLPYLENRKLVTVAKYLNVDLTNAHDAMGDIRATREVAKSLAKMGVPLQ